MTVSAFDQTFSMMRTMINSTGPLTDEKILQSIPTLEALPGFSKLQPSEVDRMLDELHVVMGTEQDEGELLEGGKHEPWLADALAEGRVDPVRWRAFRDWQQSGTGGLPQKVLATVETQTDRVVDLLGDPTAPGVWRRRGLLLGAVQSGKTINYLAIMNKAADAGYRMFVILTSNTDELRRQTQERVEEGFVGSSTRENALHQRVEKHGFGIGVRHPEIPRKTMTLTTRSRDFTSAVRSAQDGIARPSEESGYVYVAVIKKNVHALRSLTNWLAPENREGELSLPLVVIDDESDNASVNTSAEDENPTAINAGIRTLLHASRRSSYLAVTATPFANIFIDDQAQYRSDNSGVMEDLFPKDYILCLASPSNYCGVEYFFGTPDEPRNSLVHEIRDMEDLLPLKHRNGQRILGIPTSLENAVATYVVAATVAGIRGVARSGTSMLVNVSRFTSSQESVADRLRGLVEEYRMAVNLHPDRATSEAPGPVWSALREAYRRVARGVEAGRYPTWEEVASRVGGTLNAAQVRLYNGRADEWNDEHVEDPSDRRVQIAVGGLKLSRGLTLPGLMVSYVYRNVSASDVLMQMGRWFGYRDGYQDLLSVWMNPELCDNFRYTGESVQELRRDLRSMREQGLTPKDYGLKVSTRPESLLITARNKARSSKTLERVVTLSGQRIETTRLCADLDLQRTNALAADRLVSRCESEAARVADLRSTRLIVWSGVGRHLVEEFLNAYKAPRTDRYFGTLDPVRQFVRDEACPREWDVALVPGEGGARALGGVTLKSVVRHMAMTDPDNENPGNGRELRVSGRSSRLAGGDDVERLCRITGDGRAPVPGEEKRKVSETDFYRLFTRPAMMIYPLEPSPKSDEGVASCGFVEGVPMVGVKMVVPGEANSKNYRFIMQVNTVLVRQIYGEDTDYES